MNRCKVFFLLWLLVSCAKGGIIEPEQQPGDEFVEVQGLLFELNGELVSTQRGDTLILQEEGIRELKFIGYEPSNATYPKIDSINFYHDIYTFNFLGDSIVIRDDILSSAPDNSYISPVKGDFASFCSLSGQIGYTASFYNYVKRSADFATIIEDGHPMDVHWEDLGKMRSYRLEFTLMQQGQGGHIIGKKRLHLPFYERRNRAWVIADSVTLDGVPVIGISPGDTLQLGFGGLLPPEFTIFEWCKGVATGRFQQLNGANVEGAWLAQVNDPLLTDDGMRYTDSKVQLTSDGRLVVDKGWDKEGATASGGAICSTIPISLIVMPYGHPEVGSMFRSFTFPSGITVETGPRPVFCCARVEILYD